MRRDPPSSRLPAPRCCHDNARWWRHLRRVHCFSRNKALRRWRVIVLSPTAVQLFATTILTKYTNITQQTMQRWLCRFFEVIFEKVLFRSHAPFSEGAGPEPEIWVPVPRTPFVGQASCANDTVVVSLNGPSDSGTGAANVQKLELEPKTSDARSRCLKLSTGSTALVSTTLKVSRLLVS